MINVFAVTSGCMLNTFVGVKVVFEKLFNNIFYGHPVRFPHVVSAVLYFWWHCVCCTISEL